MRTHLPQYRGHLFGQFETEFMVSPTINK